MGFLVILGITNVIPCLLYYSVFLNPQSLRKTYCIMHLAGAGKQWSMVILTFQFLYQVFYRLCVLSGVRGVKLLDFFFFFFFPLQAFNK